MVPVGHIDDVSGLDLGIERLGPRLGHDSDAEPASADEQGCGQWTVKDEHTPLDTADGCDIGVVTSELE